jgi:hypothetical protein
MSSRMDFDEAALAFRISPRLLKEMDVQDVAVMEAVIKHQFAAGVIDARTNERAAELSLAVAERTSPRTVEASRRKLGEWRKVKGDLDGNIEPVREEAVPKMAHSLPRK